jgi:transglutaminase-like putative cysteine protease
MEISMKRFARSVLLVFTLLLFIPSLSAKEFLNIGTLIEKAAAVTTEQYPDSDEVLIDNFIQVRYQPDGTSETWDDTALKILTEKGKRGNRTLTLRFNTSYGTNTFSKVQVIKPDGTPVEVDIEAQNKVMVDPSQMSANIYNPNSKVMKLSVPGLEIGDTLRYVAHEIRSKTVIPDTWSDYQVFEHKSPIERTTYQVIAPKERPLVKIAHKAEIPDTVTFNELKTEQGSEIVYTWEVSGVPRMFEEPNMPTPYTVAQRLLVSTMEEWEDLSKWYWELCRPRLEATTPEMEAMAKELVSGLTNTTDKIKAIFNFVSQDIRYMGITTEEEAPGYEPHDVSITFENRYGVCRDKAALLASMLRIVDVEAFPVIIMAGPKKDEEVPQAFFNHAVTAAIDDNGEYVLMDSTDENTKDIFPSYLQNMSYIVARPEGETLLTSPIIPAEENLLKITSTGSLDKAGKLDSESTLLFEGINDTVYRGYFSKIKPEERRRFFEGHLKKSMPTATLESFSISPTELRDTSQALTVKLAYSAENLLIEGSENKMLNLPKLGSSLGYANFLLGQTGLEERKYPLYTRMTAGIRETMKLDIPSDIGTLNIPGYQPIESDQLTWNVQVKQQGNTLTATNNFLLNTVEFSPEEYLVLKKSLKEIEYNLRKKLILDLPDPESNSESDVRILEREVTIELKDQSHWKETSRSKIEILTYSGKKKNSEIKLSYNPAWQNIELTKAVVTQPDGTVKEISAEEMNLMDASWVASAPRYPTEKILVANLPGVEIGSILEYEFVSTVKGKPFFSTTQLFNSHEPMDSKTLTITAPDSLNLQVLNTGIQENKTTSNGTITYTWSMKNQSAVNKEESLPPWWTFNPALFVSTSDWKTYSKNVLSHLLKATDNQSATKALAQQLTAGVNNDREKVISMRNWVAENLRPAGPGLTSLPLSSITPSDHTVDEGYGNNPDRMVVLYSLLKAAGFKPDFILSGSLSLIPETAEPILSIPSRNAFNTVLLKVEIDGETLYLNGSSQYAELGTSAFDHRPMLDLNTGRIETISVAPEKDDRSHVVVEMSIAANGEAGLTHNTTMQGTAYESFHQSYAEITPEKRRRHYLEIVTGVSQSARAASRLITDYESYPGKLEYSIVADRYAVQDGDYLYFTVPGGLGGLLKYRANERTLPLAWGGYVDSTSEINIILPNGYEPVILPKTFSWQAPNGAGMVEVAVEYSKRANAIRMVLLADLKPALIQAEVFPDIIEASRKLSHPDMRTVLLRKQNP